MTGEHGKVDLYRNPLFVGMAASIGKIPEELFDLMNGFCSKVIERYCELKLKPKPEKSTHEEKSDELWIETKKVLGKLAFVTLKEKIWHFVVNPPFWQKIHRFFRKPSIYAHIKKIESEFSDFPKTNLPHQSKGNRLENQLMTCGEIGLLFPISKSRERNISTTSKYRFPHLLFAEFFAAVYAVENGQSKEFIKARCYESFYVEPLSYFMTGHGDASEWRKHAVKSCVQKDAGEIVLSCPWMYLSNGLPDATLGVSSIDVIRGTNSPNQGNFIEAFVAKYGITLPPHAIRFRGFTFDSASINALCTWLKKYDVIRSEAEGNEDADSEFSKFVAAYYGSNNVKEMYLRDCNLSEAFIKILADHLRQNKNLKIINVQGTRAIGSVPAFAEALCQSSAEEINLSYCDLSKTFVTTLANHQTENKSLRKLNVGGNKAIGSVHSFAAALCSSSIQEVTLNFCALTEAFTATLSDQIRNNTCLKRLVVVENTAIGSDPNFAKSLFQSSLEEVTLWACELTPEFISVFLSYAAEDSNHLKEVNMLRKGIEKKQQDELELLAYVNLY